MEIERIFLITDIEGLRAQLEELGFSLRNSEEQYAEYLDYRDFRLFNSRQDFRFRYIYTPKYPEFVRGEVSLSFREYPKTYSEVRDQISLIARNKQTVDKFKFMMLKMNMIKSFTLYKDREEYSRSTKRGNFREELHIEIDMNIQMSQYPNHQKSFKLEDTLQLCKETEKEKEAPEIDELMKELGLTTKDVVTINYGERLCKMLGCDCNPNIKI